jgi:hypothetical protein
MRHPATRYKHHHLGRSRVQLAGSSLFKARRHHHKMFSIIIVKKGRQLGFLSMCRTKAGLKSASTLVGKFRWKSGWELCQS